MGSKKIKTTVNKTKTTVQPSPFDKFIDDQIAREGKNSKRHEDLANHGVTPQQKLNKLYRETPSNRTVWSKK
jgi:hypothetical protein